MVDLSKADEAIAILKTRFVGPQLGPLHAIKGQFDWLQLRSCYELVRLGRIAVTGLQSTDISESYNRIVIGVLDLSGEPRLRDSIRELKVPQEMVIVRRQPPVYAL